ncbi:hypothetical protein QR680_014696 [Steinernema hermaphroditum]|uniref:C-type lectin domain-containing protein n=1 Tax=Steinernema hermaphroditum TaxID=289476 RepID=A0AA39ICF3_9BILA|nr:hypothetical protein QR680_014696 [Steinernema hermaphroditum]
MIGRYGLFLLLTFSAFLPVLPLAENASAYDAQKSEFWYVINPDHLSFKEAEQHCISLKGHLASIHSAVEHSVVNELTKLHGFHKYYAARLGAVRLPNTTTFIWNDESAWDFDDWLPTEPSVIKGEDNVGIFLGKWLSISLLEGRPSVCKVPASALRKAMKNLINNE